LLLQFYFFLPLHTYLVSSIRPALADAAGNMNATVAENLNDALNNETAAVAGAHEISVAEHGIHLLSDSALGVMISQLLLRNFVGLPTSRAAEAFRRVTIDGYFNPNARLATRFFILPASLVSLFLLCAPLGLANTVIGIARFSALDLAPEAKILIYRYSYPLAAAWVAMSIGGNELAKATKRWRARVRDEVYLVGERLHNFGEKRPPMGSKSVVRKEK
jgi:E3 ubiquitin-protein ligase MARCH6